jgi:hypothetical protein
MREALQPQLDVRGLFTIFQYELQPGYLAEWCVPEGSFTELHLSMLTCYAPIL